MATMTLQQLFDLAMRHHQAGRLAEAEPFYRQVLARQPNQPDALHHLGIIAHQAGRHDVAVAYMRKAVSVKPRFSEAYSNLGLALKENGQVAEAIAAYRHAIALQPELAEAWYNLGIALKDSGQVDDAIAAYRQAIVLRPNYAAALGNLGIALMDAGQVAEAITTHQHAVDLEPNHAAAHCNLGAALKQNGQLGEAILAYRRAIALKADFAEAYVNLGGVLCEIGLLDEAIPVLHQAIAINPDLPEVYANLGNNLKDMGRLDEAIAACRQAIARRAGYTAAHSNLMYIMHFRFGYDAAAIAEEHRRWNRQHAEPFTRVVGRHLNDANPDRKLRIGYVSPDFREHVVGRFLHPLLQHHDKIQFEVFAYAQVPVPDPMTEKLRVLTDRWRSIARLSDTEAADLIRQDQIDLLVDLAGHTADGRLLVFARKPAPVQVTWLGYPDTTGLTTIDYRLTDSQADPPGLTDPHTSEKLARLPHTNWVYQPPEGVGHLSPAPAAIRGEIIFGSFNNFSKVSETTLHLWCRILRSIPRSRLLLKSQNLRCQSLRQFVLQILSDGGVTSDRVEMHGQRVLRSEHFQMYHRMSIALDPFPYHGTTTTCDALWMGVPVITRAGQTHASRVGVSLLNSVGLADLIASDADDYVRIAVELATDRTRLQRIRGCLRPQMQASPLMDAAQFARDIENAYRQMWRTWCKGRPNSATPARLE